MSVAVRIEAVIPAAGRSRRMGRAKQLIRIDGVPMLLRTVRTVCAGGVQRVVAVVHSGIERVLGAGLRHEGALVVCNDDPDSEMVDSIRAGLRCLSVTSTGGPTGILIVPGDMPGLDERDVRACVEGFRQSPERIVVASWRRRRGHPVILPASLAEAVFSPLCDAGLRALLARHEAQVRVVECPTSGVLADADRPQDLPDRWR